jgi:dUTP pyrophosphatase
MIINYKHLTKYAHAPVKKHKADACFDLRASESVTIPAHGYGTARTELAIRIPAGHVGFIMSRSGLASKHGVFVLNAPGIIDAEYSGEIKVVLGNMDDFNYLIERGDKIAQFMVQPLMQTNLLRGDNMVWSGIRGDRGFGSTGY